MAIGTVEQRLANARKRLDRATAEVLHQMQQGVARIAWWRARVARLEAAARIPEAERQARARRAVRTRRTKAMNRRINLEETDG